VIVARALALLEEHLGQTAHKLFRLTAGTSTGSIISAAIGAGLTGEQIYQLYCELGESIFPRTWRSILWPLTPYRYTLGPLEDNLRTYIGDITMGDYWSADPPTDVVVTAFDLVSNHTRFVKSWKPEYADWPATQAVMASSAVPTYFPPVEGRYVDGGVGAYTNPCYIAAYEAQFVLGWDMAETTLLSLGTGRNPHTIQPGEVDHYWAWDWIDPVLGAFLQSAADQQVHLVDTFFDQLDFRRFQIDLPEHIAMDDTSAIPTLTAYGDQLAQKIINDEMDAVLNVTAQRAPDSAL